jgi:hypothetical protein
MTSQDHSSQSDSSSRDRRLTNRYSIAGIAAFRWTSADGRYSAGSGLTQNIGKAGVFVECEVLPPAASALEVDVALSLNWNHDVTVRLRGTGHVCHIRPGMGMKSGYGAAVVFHMESPTADENMPED